MLSVERRKIIERDGAMQSTRGKERAKGGQEGWGGVSWAGNVPDSRDKGRCRDLDLRSEVPNRAGGLSVRIEKWITASARALLNWDKSKASKQDRQTRGRTCSGVYIINHRHRPFPVLSLPPSQSPLKCDLAQTIQTATLRPRRACLLRGTTGS